MKALFIFLAQVLFVAQLAAQSLTPQAPDDSIPLPDYESLSPETRDMWNFMIRRNPRSVVIQIPAATAKFCTGCTLRVYDLLGHLIVESDGGFLRGADGGLGVKIVLAEDFYGRAELVIGTAGNPKAGMTYERGGFTFKLSRGSP